MWVCGCLSTVQNLLECLEQLKSSKSIFPIKAKQYVGTYLLSYESAITHKHHMYQHSIQSKAYSYSIFAHVGRKKGRWQEVCFKGKLSRRDEHGANRGGISIPKNNSTNSVNIGPIVEAELDLISSVWKKGKLYSYWKQQCNSRLQRVRKLLMSWNRDLKPEPLSDKIGSRTWRRKRRKEREGEKRKLDLGLEVPSTKAWANIPWTEARHDGMVSLMNSEEHRSGRCGSCQKLHWLRFQGIRCAILPEH